MELGAERDQPGSGSGWVLVNDWWGLFSTAIGTTGTAIAKRCGYLTLYFTITSLSDINSDPNYHHNYLCLDHSNSCLVAFNSELFTYINIMI